MSPQVTHGTEELALSPESVTMQCPSVTQPRLVLQSPRDSSSAEGMICVYRSQMTKFRVQGGGGDSKECARNHDTGPQGPQFPRNHDTRVVGTPVSQQTRDTPVPQSHHTGHGLVNPTHMTGQLCHPSQPTRREFLILCTVTAHLLPRPNPKPTSGPVREGVLTRLWDLLSQWGWL